MTSSDNDAAPVPESSIVGFLRAVAEVRPDAPALSTEAGTTTYGALMRSSARLAGELAEHGLQPGARVALVLPDGPGLAAAYYGVLMAGAVAVPMNALAAPRRLAAQLSHSRPSVVLASACLSADAWTAAAAGAAPDVALMEYEVDSPAPGDGGALPTSVEPNLGDTAVIVYGLSDDPDLPEAVELSHGSLARAATTLSDSALRLTPDDVVLGLFPMTSMLGQMIGLNAVVHAGACLAARERYEENDILATVAEDGVTVLGAYPVVFSILLRAQQRGGPDLGTLRAVFGAGGSTMTSRMRSALTDTFGCEVIECWGPSETAAVACATPRGGSPAGSIGRATGGMSVQVLGRADRGARPGKLGELVVSGPTMMEGYWDDSEETDRVLRNGWLHTGRQARIDEDGWIYLAEGGGWLQRTVEPGAGRDRGVGLLSRLRAR